MTTKKLLAGAGVVIMIILFVSAVNWIGVQQNNIGSLQNEIAMLRSELINKADSSELENAKQEILEGLTNQNKNAYNASYKITGYSKEENLAYVLIRFSLKSYHEAVPVSVSYMQKGDSQSIPARYQNGIFEADLKLPLNAWEEPVALQILIQDEAAIQTEQLLDISPYGDLHDRIAGKETSISWSSERNKATVDIFYGFQNHFGDDEKLKFTSCILTVTGNGQVLKTIALTNSLHINGDYQMLKEESLLQSLELDKVLNEETLPLTAEITAVDGYGFVYTW